MKNTFMKTYNEYIWAVSQGSMTSEKTAWFSKATLSERGPDFSRAKLAILSHADWFECIWMTVLTPPGISSCLCARLESELHFKESPTFILASPSEPRRRGPTHLYAALARSSPCSNWLTNINKIFFLSPYWHNAIHRSSSNIIPDCL